MVAITNNRHKPLEPRELIEVLYGIKVRVWAPRRRLALAEVVVIVVQTKATSEEPLDQSQLGSFLLGVAIGDGRERIERLPSPLVSLMIRWRGGLRVVLVVAECTLASLSAIVISGATRIAEFMATPDDRQRREKGYRLLVLWILLFIPRYEIYHDIWVSNFFVLRLWFRVLSRDGVILRLDMNNGVPRQAKIEIWVCTTKRLHIK